ncbi:hypothetical protein KY328_04700 [Candidatus Woesearchaeota archaeon]|nr:hypothetical protein [Candidatus Woesearchaeota archaeon]MBW3022197.1 hypothetical protein [Candidatus Woesearchaeota archaeon]
MISDKIYGVDPNSDFTPLMVRDAIIECFFLAHKEILDKKDKYYPMKSQEELIAMKHNDVVELIQGIMQDNNDDFDNPTKESLLRVIESLKKIAAKYRAEEIIQKHAREIMILIKKL